MRCSLTGLTALASLMLLAGGASAYPPVPVADAPALDVFQPLNQFAARPGDRPAPIRLWADDFEIPEQKPVAQNAGVVDIFGELPLGASANLAPTMGEADNLLQVSFAVEGSDFDPVVSRDGDFLFYASTQHSYTSDIYVKPVRGRAITQLTSDPGNDVLPAVSPDGARVAFASDRNGSWDIFLMNAEGGQAVRLTDSAAHELHPTWSPDGKMLAFSRLGEVSGRWELWVTEANNPGVSQFLGYGLFPEWSPVDNKIAFQRSREQGDRFFSVWTIDFEDGEARNPTEIASSPVAAIVNPSWSPDGSYLVFSAIAQPEEYTGGKPTNADIWIARADGSGLANLTGGAFVNISPFWGRDQSIYFVSNRGGADNIWSVRPRQAVMAAGGTVDRDERGTNIAEVNENER